MARLARRGPDVVHDAGDRCRRARDGFQERTGPSNLAFAALAWIADPACTSTALRHGGVRRVSTRSRRASQALVGVRRAGPRREPATGSTPGTTAGYDAARARFAEEPHGGRMPTDVTYLFDRPRREVVPRPGGRRPARGACPRPGRRRAAAARGAGGWLAYDRVPGAAAARPARRRRGRARCSTGRAAHVWDDRAGGDGVHDRLPALLRRQDARPPGGVLPAGRARRAAWSINGLPTPTVAEALERDLERIVAAAVPVRVPRRLPRGQHHRRPGC